MIRGYIYSRNYSRLVSGIKELLSGTQSNRITEQQDPLPESPPPNGHTPKPTTDDVKAHLQTLAESMFNTTHSDTWTDLRFTDMQLKAKILMSCGEVFGRHIPNNSLNSIETFGDVFKFYDTPSKPRPGALFPNIRENLSTLPPNLSVEFPPKRRKEPQRVPFQNYNDLKHRTFQNKKKLRKN